MAHRLRARDGRLEIACPECGSTDIAADWAVCVTVSFTAGRPTGVCMGGFKGGMPDQLLCHRCGTEVDLTGRRSRDLDALADAICDAVPARYDDQTVLAEA